MSGEDRDEQRSSTRYAVRVPVSFDGGEGATRDVSTCGVLFETTATVVIGQRLDLILTFGDHSLRLKASGRVVRIVASDHATAVAIELGDAAVEPII